MTGVTFKGRLGNQLFQFFYFVYLKSTSKGQLVYIVNPHHSYISRYFDLGGYNLFLGSKLVSLITRFLPKLIKSQDIYHQNFTSPRKITARPCTVHHGYFQTDWYIQHAREKVNISVKEKFVREFQHLFGTLFENNKTIAVHIRRTDYLNYGKRDISIPIQFFKSQLSAIENLDSYKVIFLSDDMDFVKKEFPMRDNFIFSSHSEIIDFQIIQNADIAIISNSSFSWWAAYLSPKNNCVIAPKYWFGFKIGREHPKGIMTSKFKWVAVDN
jgi:hypothetical protein